MKIIRDLENEPLFAKRIWQNPKADRQKEIHVSDLIYCLRKAYYRLKGQTPTNPTTVEYQIIGKSLHNIIENAFAYTENEITNYGIKGTIDILEGETKIPIEIKTTRAKIETPEQIPETYLKQLSYYLVLLNVSSGYLAILDIINAQLRLFLVQYEKSELEMVKMEMLFRKALLEKALQNNTPTMLPKLEWQCKSCEYRGVCQNGEM